MIVGHVLLPLTLLLRLRQAAGGEVAPWLTTLFLAGTYLAYLYLAGAWSWFGGALRHAWLVALVLTALLSRPGAGDAPSLAIASPAEMAFQIALGITFLTFALRALRARSLREDGLDLQLPLHDGTFHVGQGGASKVLNHHFGHPSQRYALDLLKLNGLGVRAAGLYPLQPERYAIWGALVVSPCDGVIAAVVDGFQDFVPPQRDRENPAGNYIAMEADGNGASEGSTIYLAHLKKGSMRVRPGDRVRAGQPLAQVGNSGNTTEPHLHVHAERGRWPGRFSGMPAIALRIQGRFLVRNDRVVAGGPRETEREP